MNDFNIKLSFIILALSINFTSAAQSVATVGISSGSLCDFTQIQTAIDSGADEIRILNNQTFQENLVLDRQIDIKGGYPNCSAAVADQHNGTRTEIDASGVLGLAAIQINNTNNAAIQLHRLALKNAIDTSSIDGGRGININNSSGLIELFNVNIFNNTADYGAGIYAAYPPALLQVILNNSYIYENNANAQGGGIFCGGDDTYISLINNSGIFENQALNGGGIAAFAGCTVTIASGADVRLSETYSGIVRNIATNNGGGMYVGSGSKVFFQGNRYGPGGIFGNTYQPTTLADNHAFGNGGGLAAYGGSQIEMYDAMVWSNSAVVNGGGFYLDEEVSFLMTTSSQSTCWNQGMCSILALNTADLGGAVYQSRGSTTQFNKSHIYKNGANWGLVVYSREDGTAGTESKFHNNMIYRHGNNAFDREDKYLFRGYEPVSIELLHNTIAENDIVDNTSIMGASLGATFTVKNSIIYNNNETVYNGPSSGIDAACLMVNEQSSFTGSNIAQGNPSFVDSLNNDFHIKVTSYAADMCASINGLTHDIDGEARGFDAPLTNLDGPYDAGADETYASDVIFKTNFE